MSLFRQRALPDLWRITCADLIVRTAYQIGKTPLLPLYAATLGASEFLLGAIVSVSTMTGLFLKPLFGWLSDRGGRKFWLLLALILFTCIPFLYFFVQTPQQLFVLRLIHGFATAIFGPVTLAYVAEMAREGTAERLGWFGMARSAGYLLAPMLAVWLLTWMQPVEVFMVIGFLSGIAFIPVLMMTFPDRSTAAAQRRKRTSARGFVTGFSSALRVAVANPALWLAGTLEMLVYMATYAIKAFLPLYALYTAGFELLLVGAFFSAQEAANMLMRPLGGRLGDRFGYLRIIAAGLGLAALGLLLLPLASTGLQFLVLAVLLGLSQGLIFPSTLALASNRLGALNLGTGLGFLGTMGSIGKVIGPALIGLLLSQTGYQQVFHLLALLMLALGLFIFIKRGVYTPWQSSRSS